jgi:hypothetical protein
MSLFQAAATVELMLQTQLDRRRAQTKAIKE